MKKSTMSSVFSSWLALLVSVFIAVLCLWMNWHLVEARSLALNWALPLVIVLVACALVAWNAIKAIKAKVSVKGWISRRLFGVDVTHTETHTVGGVNWLHAPLWMFQKVDQETGAVTLELSKAGLTPPKGMVYDTANNEFVSEMEMKERKRAAAAAKAAEEAKAAEARAAAAKAEDQKQLMAAMQQMVQQMMQGSAPAPSAPAPAPAAPQSVVVKPFTTVPNTPSKS